MMTRGPAVLATTLALAMVNAGLAILIVAAIGVRGFAPLWLGAVLLLVGIAAAVAAVMLWREYLAAARGNDVGTEI
jgi:hypothetical protein